MDTSYIKKNSLRIFVCVIICMFLILVDGMGWMDPVYSWGNYLLKPLEYWTGRLVSGVDNSIKTVLEIGNLRSDNSDLKVKKAKLEAKLSKLKEVEKENEILRNQLGIEITEELELEQVRVLGLDKNGMAEHVIIDGGIDDDIRKGDAVVLGDVLIGVVRDVYKSTSRVRLVSNQDSNIIVMDQETRAKGLVHGSLSGIVMEEVLENEELEEGDMVITWSDEIPKGLVIGEIKEIEVVPTSSTKRAYIDSGINLEELNYVFVVLNK